MKLTSLPVVGTPLRSAPLARQMQKGASVAPKACSLSRSTLSEHKKGRNAMTINIKSHTFLSEAQRNKIEQDLQSKGFVEVPTLSKLKPGQYQKSQAPGNQETFEGPVKYTISWYIDE